MGGAGFDPDVDAPVRIDADGTVAEANEEARTALDVSDVVETSVADLFGEAAGDRIHSALAESAALPESVRVDREDDGWIEFSLFPSGEGITAIGRERGPDDEPRATLQRKAEMLDVLPVAVYRLDEYGRAAYFNEAFAEMLGQDPESMVGLSVTRALRAEDIERGQELIREMLSEDPTTGTTRSFEQLTFTIDGKRIPCENRMALLMDGDEFAGTAGAVVDVSDRKQERERIQVLERVLRHNVRTQLALVEGHLEGMTLPDEESERHAAAISEAIDDLLVFSRKIRRIGGAIIDRDERRTVALEEYVGDHLEQLSGRYPDVEFEEALEGGTTVLAGSAIEIALGELLDNAAKHNDADDPWVRVESAAATPEISGAYEAYDQSVGVRILDNGPGIPEQDRAVVTGEREVSPLQHSEGLGLWTAGWIVQAYDGTLRIEDREPRGAVVEALLPPGDRSDDGDGGPDSS